MAGLKKPGLYILRDMINYCCTVLRVYTQSDSGGWYEVLYPPAKIRSLLPHFCLVEREKRQSRFLTGSDFGNTADKPQVCAETEKVCNRHPFTMAHNLKASQQQEQEEKRSQEDSVHGQHQVSQ